ncbi:MAG: hypothetical protein M0Z53_05705 [Thermaerobacter sp.]|nr:hypothetical protein [Thermaerobacter sp.]
MVSIGKAPTKTIGMSIEGLRKWASAGILIPLHLDQSTPHRVEDLRALIREDPPHTT